MNKFILKGKGWSDLIIPVIFIIFGILLMINPEGIASFISIVLGVIFLVEGFLKIIQYFVQGRENQYVLAVGIMLVIIGIIILLCADIILSAFRILIAIWIILNGIINLQYAIMWKDYKSKLWLITLILSIAIVIAGIYILINNGAIFQTIGMIIVIYGVIDIFENIVFMKKANDYIEI